MGFGETVEGPIQNGQPTVWATIAQPFQRSLQQSKEDETQPTHFRYCFSGNNVWIGCGVVPMGSLHLIPFASPDVDSVKPQENSTACVEPKAPVTATEVAVRQNRLSEQRAT